MQTDIQRLTELNQEFFQFFSGYMEWYERVVGVGGGDTCELNGSWQNNNAKINVKYLAELHELTNQAIEDLKLAEAMIHDLREEANGLRPLTWRRNCEDNEIVEVFKQSDRPLHFREARQILLCKGIDLEGTYQISDVCRQLEREKVLFDVHTYEYVHIESPAWQKLSKRHRKNLRAGVKPGWAAAAKA